MLSKIGIQFFDLQDKAVMNRLIGLFRQFMKEKYNDKQESKKKAEKRKADDITSQEENYMTETFAQGGDGINEPGTDIFAADREPSNKKLKMTTESGTSQKNCDSIVSMGNILDI